MHLSSGPTLPKSFNFSLGYLLLFFHLCDDIKTGGSLCVMELHSGTPGSRVAIVCVCGVWDNGGSGVSLGANCVWTCGARDLSL